MGVLPRPLRDPAGSRGEGHGVPERDEGCRGGRPSDASGAEDEVVGHGASPLESMVSTAHIQRMTAPRPTISRALLTFLPTVAGSGAWSLATPDRLRAPRPAVAGPRWASGRATGSPSRRTSCAWRASTSPRTAPPPSASGRSPATSAWCPPGIYRYVDSRDELLTRLIVDSYWLPGAAVRAAHDTVAREDLDARWDTLGPGPARVGASTGRTTSP